MQHLTALQQIILKQVTKQALDHMLHIAEKTNKITKAWTFAALWTVFALQRQCPSLLQHVCCSAGHACTQAALPWHVCTAPGQAQQA